MVGFQVKFILFNALISSMNTPVHVPFLSSLMTLYKLINCSTQILYRLALSVLQLFSVSAFSGNLFSMRLLIRWTISKHFQKLLSKRRERLNVFLVILLWIIRSANKQKCVSNMQWLWNCPRKLPPKGELNPSRFQLLCKGFRFKVC